jgi:hypothetical protein
MKVIGPTLPRNMTTEIRILPNVLRCGVTSSESPTVPNAEVTSKRAARSSSPSETMSAGVLRRTSKEARANTESALATSGRGNARQKSVILSYPLTWATMIRATSARGVTFMPPRSR